MPLKVMNAEGGNVQCVGKAVGDAGTHQQCARKAGTLGVGNGIEVSERKVVLSQQFPRERDDAPNVIARGQFRNNAAVVGVHGDL